MCKATTNGVRPEIDMTEAKLLVSDVLRAGGEAHFCCGITYLHAASRVFWCRHAYNGNRRVKNDH